MDSNQKQLDNQEQSSEVERKLPSSHAESELEKRDDVLPAVDLVTIRENLGLSVQEISNRTKFSHALIEALEARQYEQLSKEPLFRRGFVQSYAKVLGIDPGPILQDIENQLPVEKQGNESIAGHTQTLVHATSKRSGWLWFIAIVAGLFALFYGLSASGYLPDTWLKGFFQDKGQVEQAENKETTEEEDFFGTVASSVLTEQEPVQDEVATEDMIQPMTSEDALENVTQPIPEQLPVLEESLTPVEEKGLERSPALGIKTIVIDAARETWIKVQDNQGQVIFSDLLQAGTQERISGEAPLQVLVGNVAGTVLSIDGKVVDLTEKTNANVARVKLP